MEKNLALRLIAALRRAVDLRASVGWRNEERRPCCRHSVEGMAQASRTFFMP